MVPFDDPDAVKLRDEVQQEYVVRYGEPDETPLHPGEFDPPHGLFLVGYLDGDPVATGAWRRPGLAELRPGDIELKRMYVAERARGRRFARALLAELERTAALAGGRRVVLESGVEQPEALGLYRSCGYTGIPNYGHYREDPRSVCLAKELAPPTG
ncbi:GNAT family N-acetyltransferase [Amycolatopsis antarctica]|uniref:GNAT family N-acetyltransferase n=1 Tax=Amycolatopsis antarctica TaxID=1854586 RepID=A0A263D6Q9_9PSEU|nr:GNAT family N-acetyltransferase [Amycolatopsis antarctica]